MVIRCARIVKAIYSDAIATDFIKLTLRVKMPSGYGPENCDWWYGVYLRYGFLGEITPIIQFISVVIKAFPAFKKTGNQNMKIELEVYQKKLELLKIFPNTPEYLAQDLIRAENPKELRTAVDALFDQGLSRIEVSKEPFDGNIEVARMDMRDIKLFKE